MDKILYDNKWIRVVERTKDGEDGYVFTTLPWCNSMGVSVLPYRRITNRSGAEARREYLAIYERCIPHSDHLKLGCITGGCDDPTKSIREIALMELHEEGGIQCDDLGKLVSLGYVRPNKSSDVITYLFAFEVTHLYEPMGESIGDGTGHEDGMFPTWISREEGLLSEDPVLATMIARCELHFKV